MTDLESFQFPTTGQAVRTVMRDGEPWFVAKDACDVIGISKYRDAVAQLDEDERVSTTVDTLGGPQVMTLVNEAGLYALMLITRSPKVKPFRRWVTHDVLPTIRKTGGYRVPRTLADALDLAANQAREIDAREKRLAIVEPMAEQAALHRAADGLVSVGDFANKLKAWALREHGVRIKHDEVWDFLGQIGLIIRGQTIRNNQPTAWAIERDFVRVKETTYETNTRGAHTSASSRLTPAGEGWAWDRAVCRIVERGSLAPTKDIERKAS